ncbi:putative transcriptional regulator [Weissella beninensis]|uniref:DNA-binding protein n=1 Tax=Periweissella beninensis TaxID=504936 RepID=A0ABT0VEV0_9LACO|nr:hypothetical protein [Periweissella beninensis]MBM7545036.1 putative transcriptional regulator [Periweissella beninensis]MCM2436368.1 hypothetical protein [Periweissella beninensis]
MDSKEFNNVAEMLVYFDISKPTLYKRLSANGFKTSKRQFTVDELRLVKENQVKHNLTRTSVELEKLKAEIDELTKVNTKLTAKNEELSGQVADLLEQNKNESADFKKLLDQAQQLQLDLQQQLKAKDQLLIETSTPKGFWARLWGVRSRG